MRQEMAAAAAYASLEPGAYLFHEGARFSQCALIGKGSLRVFKQAETGRQITLYRVGKGETCMMTMLCLAFEREAPASGQAETPIQAALIPAADLIRWMRTWGFMKYYVLETVTTRLIDVMILVDQIAFGKMDRRLAAYLIRQFARPNGTGLRELKTTHEGIASELGSAREVVSRLLEDLQQAGAVTLQRGRIRLEDERLLRRLSQGN